MACCLLIWLYVFTGTMSKKTVGTPSEYRIYGYA
jgi:hypothetical protein